MVNFDLILVEPADEEVEKLGENIDKVNMEVLHKHQARGIYLPKN